MGWRAVETADLNSTCALFGSEMQPSQTGSRTAGERRAKTGPVLVRGIETRLRRRACAPTSQVSPRGAPCAGGSPGDESWRGPPHVLPKEPKRFRLPSRGCNLIPTLASPPLAVPLSLTHLHQSVPDLGTCTGPQPARGSPCRLWPLSQPGGLARKRNTSRSATGHPPPSPLPPQHHLVPLPSEHPGICFS